MKHQIKNKKLNLSFKHRKAFLRNQVLHFIQYGKLQSTLANVKEVRRLAEKVVTIAKHGNTYQNRRKVLAILPYNDEIVKKLFLTIAPQYEARPGGYTRIFKLGVRLNDTAPVALLAWV
jgi:large subunit ribosomal protein L17